MQKNSRKITNLRYIKGKQAGRTYHTQHKDHHTPLQATFRLLPNNNMSKAQEQQERLENINLYLKPGFQLSIVELVDQTYLVA